ncbi:MAG TPA: PilN domain-containing protein [Gaiellaceae bacterium]|nr:PilN domain-containing protein [Gaiellaceae bacterium]
MDAVNLLPAEYRDRKRRRQTPADNLDGRRTLRIGGGVALLFVALLVGLFLHEHQLVNSKQKELASNKSQIAAVQPQVDAVKAAQAAVSGRLTVARSLTGSRMNWDRALNDFARIIPTSSFLTSIQMTAPITAASQATAVAATPATTDSTTPAPAPAPAGVSTLTLGGTSPSTPGVALVMDRLALLPWLSDVTLTSAARQDTGANNFSMTATVSEAH